MTFNNPINKLLDALKNRISKSRYLRDEKLVLDLEAKDGANLPTEYRGYNAQSGESVVQRLGQEPTTSKSVTNSLISAGRQVQSVGDRGDRINFTPAVSNFASPKSRLRKAEGIYPFVSLSVLNEIPRKLLQGANTNQKEIGQIDNYPTIFGLTKTGNKKDDVIAIWRNSIAPEYYFYENKSVLPVTIAVASYNRDFLGSNVLCFYWDETLQYTPQMMTYQTSGDNNLSTSKTPVNTYCSVQVYNQTNLNTTYYCNDRDYGDNNYIYDRIVDDYYYINGSFSGIAKMELRFDGSLNETDWETHFHQLRNIDLGSTSTTWVRSESVYDYKKLEQEFGGFVVPPGQGTAPTVMINNYHRQVSESQINLDKAVIHNNKTIDYERNKYTFNHDSQYSLNGNSIIGQHLSNNAFWIDNYSGEICTKSESREYTAINKIYTPYICSSNGNAGIYSYQESQDLPTQYWNNTSRPINLSISYSYPTYYIGTVQWLFLGTFYPPEGIGNQGNIIQTLVWDTSLIGNKAPKYYLAEEDVDTELRTYNSWYLDLYGINLWGQGLTIPDDLPAEIAINLLDGDGYLTFSPQSKYDDDRGYGIFREKFNHWEATYTETYDNTFVSVSYHSQSTEDHGSEFFNNLIGQNIILVGSTGNLSCDAWEGTITGYTYSDQPQVNFDDNGFESYPIVRAINSLTLTLTNKFTVPFDGMLSYENTGSFMLYSSNFTYYLTDQYQTYNSNLVKYKNSWHWFTWYSPLESPDVIAYKLNPDTMEFNLDKTWFSKNKKNKIFKHNLVTSNYFSYYPD